MLREAPIKCTEDDKLGFDKAARSLCKELQNDDAEGDRLFGVFGPWGAGKTSFLNLVKAHGTDELLWVEFDALYHQATKDVLVPLVVELARTVDRKAQFSEDLFNSLRRFLKVTSLSVADAILRKTTGLKVSDVEHHAKTEGHSRVQIPESPAESLIRLFECLVKGMQDEDAHRNVVIVVDNLDRCRPDAALGFIESLMVLRKVDHLRVVVAADRDALTSFIDREFQGVKFRGALYLEKIFPHTITVPEERGVTEEFIVTLTKSQLAAVYGDDKQMIAEILSRASATRNPRRLKRIIRRLSRVTEPPEGSKEMRWALPVLLAVTLAETWPTIYSYWSMYDRVGWKALLSDSGLGGASKSGETSAIPADCAEFLRSFEKKGNLEAHDENRRTVSMFRSQLQI